MIDQLLDYLLQALEQGERRTIERLLERDAESRRQLEILRRGLELLEQNCSALTTPTALAKRTCQHVQTVRIQRADGESS